MDWGSCLNTVKDVSGKDVQVPTLSCLPVIWYNVVLAAVTFAGVVAVFFIIQAGVKLVTSGGDQKQVDSARRTLSFAIFGLILVFLSFGIINVISAITKVSCITSFGFTCPTPTP